LIGLQIETFAWNLNQYVKAGGNEIVIESYQYRYGAITVWLDVMGLLTSSRQTHSLFKPKEFRKYMVEEPTKS
jgi:hypothetical protein